MKNDHPPVHGHGKAPHSTDHKMHHEHLKQHSGGHDHHSVHFMKHGSMEYEQDRVRKMCGGGMGKK